MSVNQIGEVGSWKASLKWARKTLGLLPLGIAFWSVPALAQIVPDNTLGTEGSQVTPNVDIQGLPGERIDGGAVRGSALFHSFSEFNVNDGQRVYFGNPSGIDNILTRVTGGNVSNILGTLGVDGAANLFLLNPNGILFGPNARLDIQGSFVASTGSGFQFADGSEFSATNPDAAPLLTMSVTPGVQWGTQLLGEINNAGNLEVGSGQTLALHGGDVTNTGSLSAPGGTVMMLGDRIGLLDNARINVSSQTGGGTVLIGGGLQGKGAVPNARRTFVDGGVEIEADALTTGDGGNVIVWADEVTGFYGNISARGGIEAGNGGFVEVSGKEHLIFRGNVDTSASQGNPGTLLLDPENITIVDGDGAAQVNGNGAANDAQLNDGQILQGDGGASSFTISENTLENLAGDTNVILQATSNITIENLADNTLAFQAGSGRIALTADSDSNGVGSFLMQDVQDTLYTSGRNIEISGASLTLGNINTSFENGGDVSLSAQGDLIVRDIEANGLASGHITLTTEGTVSINNSKIQSETTGSETGGDINITADMVEILDGGLIASRTSSSGDAGNVTINTKQLLIQNSQRDSGQRTGITTGIEKGVSGDGGDIFIYASELVELIGNKPGEFIPDLTNSNAVFQIQNILVGLTTTSFGSGKAGNLSIETKQFTIQDGAGAAAATLGTESDAGAGGEMRVSANTIEFQGLAGLATATIGPAKAGDLIVKADNITLRDGASILADAVGNPGIVRQSGNISITAQTLLLDNRSRISATTDTGDGGDIQLQNLSFSNVSGTTGGNINLKKLQTLQVTDSLISTSTQSGKAGSVRIETTESVNLSGTFTDEDNNSRGAILAETTGSGQAGSVIITTPTLNINDGARVSTTTTSTANDAGTGGNITVSANTLKLDGTYNSRTGLFAETEGAGDAGNLKLEPYSGGGDLLVYFAQAGPQISVSTSGSGTGGKLEVTAPNSVTLSGDGYGELLASASNAGNGGNIEITSNGTVSITNYVIGTFNTGTGNGGDITVDAGQTVNIKNSTIYATTNGTYDAAENKLSSNSITNNSGIAGDVTIRAGANNGPAITLTGTGIDVAAFGSEGQTGSVTLEASNRGDITLRGANYSPIIIYTDSYSNRSTKGIFLDGGNILIDNYELDARVFGGADGGNISIDGNSVTVLNKSKLITSTQRLGQGRSGNITINASRVTLNNEAKIFAEADSGKAGDINITATDLLLLRNESNISTSAGRDGAGGNGGTITIDAENGFVIAVPSENSNIVANAFGGQGGKITINANRVLGLKPESRVTTGDALDNIIKNPPSQISAGSDLGFEGTIEINTLLIDPSQGLGELPIEIVDPRGLIATGCGPTSGTTANRQSEFVVTGRGGLPPGPNDLQTPGTPSPDWVTRDVGNVANADIPDEPPTIETTDTLVEAQGMVKTANGELLLTADVPTATPHQSRFSPQFCSPVSDRR
ncbi:two-partner secretion domain-containing protein [Lyngbya aestuarii]|uniref:two-partner secretion domain-containing protein n=1 Tax=Lyngbya aestuarii TaxID=118322 RepID=UPI00403DB821